MILAEAFKELESKIALHKSVLALEGVSYRPESAHAALSSWMLSRWLSRRPGASPRGGRASGDSGWVAHLQALTRGAAGWEPGYTLVRVGESDGLSGRRGQWAFVSDGRLSLFLDEPGQYSPPAARPGERVSVRVPRARENLTPHRFTLLGNHGAPSPGERVSKLFIAASLEAAALLVASLSARSADGLRFSLFVGNEPRDFERTDNLVMDVAFRDEPAAVKLVGDFFKGQSGRLLPLRPPLQAQQVVPGLAKTEITAREDAGDGYFRRRADQLAAVVLDGLHAGELSAAQWSARVELETRR
ncbi:MAG: hypothetical protein H6Q89_929 [Myxococcaceae bacterium]|nr:hypothetical protein [Myxococcaceae bacterium]